MAVIAIASALTIATGGSVDAQEQSGTIDGGALAQMLADAESGSPDVDLVDVTIVGAVDLGGLQVIDRPIRCTRCTFTGAVSLADVRFGGVVELVDAVFEQPVDARGAVFGRAAVFDGARFESRLDASTARFDSVASFAGVDFLGDASFERASFGDRAVFTGTSGVGAADRVDICRRRRGSSTGPARFAGATFSGPGQFRERCFADVAEFVGVRFADDAEFSGTTFGSSATFERATFDADASFRVADFGGSASFEGASISETLSFDTAVIRSRLRLEALGGSGKLALAGADICRAAEEGANDTSPDDASRDDPVLDPIPPPCSTSAERRLILTRLAVESVTIDLADIDAIGGPTVQIEVLERVAATARAEGRTGVANDARFELLSRKHDALDQPQRFYDGLFYRDIAGYLVRPTHPLVWFTLLVAVGAVVRTLSRLGTLRRPTHPDRRGAGAASTAIAVVGLVVSSIAETLHTAFSVSLPSDDGPAAASVDGDGTTAAFEVSLEGGMTVAAASDGEEGANNGFDVSLAGGAVAVAPSAGDDAGEPEPDVPSLGDSLLDGVRSLEWLAFKVLIAVFLLGVANANSTIKELIDSVI